jgi:Mn2+/Fe2+ NRAMP family transporter
MSATAKTLGSLGIALVGLIVYLGIFVGYAVFKISFFGWAIYLGLALTVVLFVIVLLLTSAKEIENSHS